MSTTLLQQYEHAEQSHGKKHNIQLLSQNHKRFGKRIKHKIYTIHVTQATIIEIFYAMSEVRPLQDCNAV